MKVVAGMRCFESDRSINEGEEFFCLTLLKLITVTGRNRASAEDSSLSDRLPGTEFFKRFARPNSFNL